MKLVNHESIVRFKLFPWGDRYFKTCVGTEGRWEQTVRPDDRLGPFFVQPVRKSWGSARRPAGGPGIPPALAAHAMPCLTFALGPEETPAGC